MKKLLRTIRKTINLIFSRRQVSDPLPMKNIINNNFKKIQDEIDKFGITLSILIEDSQRREKESLLIFKALGEINNELESIRDRNKHAN